MHFELIAIFIFLTHVVAVALLALWFGAGCPSSMAAFGSWLVNQFLNSLPFRTPKPVKTTSPRV